MKDFNSERVSLLLGEAEELFLQGLNKVRTAQILLRHPDRELYKVVAADGNGIPSRDAKDCPTVATHDRIAIEGVPRRVTAHFAKANGGRNAVIPAKTIRKFVRAATAQPPKAKPRKGGRRNG